MVFSKPKNRIKTVAIVAVLVVATVAGWFIWQQQSKTPEPSATPASSDKGAVNDFQSCVDAGNRVQESYPAVCVTDDGQSFTDDVTPPITETPPVSEDPTVFQPPAEGQVPPSSQE